MKILTSDDGKTHAILVDTKEAKVLYEALRHAVDPEKPTLNKRSNAYKLADEISNLLPIW